METIAEVRVPASEAAFESTFDALPEFRFEVEPVVESREGSATPPVWVGGASREEIEDAFADDSTVEGVELVSAEDDRWLYHVDWASHMNILTDIFLVGGGTLLDAFGRDGNWWLRLLYADVESLGETLDNCRERGVAFEIVRLVKIADGGESAAAEPAVDGVAGAEVTVTADLDDAASALARESDSLSGDRTEAARSALRSHVGGTPEEPG